MASSARNSAAPAAEPLGWQAVFWRVRAAAPGRLGPRREMASAAETAGSGYSSKYRSCCAAWLLCWLGSGCDPFHADFAPVENAEEYRASRDIDVPGAKQTLVVMTYNIKFGGGRIDFFFDCHGDRVLMTRVEVLEHLEGIAAKIRQVDPDVLFLQEVDVNSKRSAFVDQLQALLDTTDLNYGLYASQWRADFVPSDGLGPVDSGNAIASKYPLHDGKRIALTLRSDQSGLERYFYLRRNLLTARLDERALGEPVYLVTTHTAAYAQDGTKLDHIQRFEQELSEWAEDGIALGGGDLNTIPPGSEKLRAFDDSACDDEFQADDFSQEAGWLDTLYAHFAPAIPLEDYRANNAPYFTHTTDGQGTWNRKLDYLFSNAHLGSGLVHQSVERGGMNTLALSDHAPVTAVLSTKSSETDGDAGVPKDLDAGSAP